MELQLEEFKAPIEVHFVDGVPHAIMFSARDMPLQLGIKKERWTCWFPS
jgi:hypothetical protein